MFGDIGSSSSTLSSLIAIFLGVGAVAYFLGKFAAGRKDGTEAVIDAADTTVAKTIENLKNLAESQTKRMNDQDLVIQKANSKALELQSKVEKLEHELNVMKNIPLEKISATLEAIERHMETQDRLWTDHLKIEAATTPTVQVPPGHTVQVTN